MAMDDILGMPVDDRIKLMTVMLADGYTDRVETLIERHGGAEVREFASHCLKLLTESRLALVAVGGK